MSTKTIISTLIGVLLIAGAVYIALSKRSNETVISPVSSTGEQQKMQQQTPPQPEAQTTVKEPAKSASSDEIIDYLVDGLTSDESKVTEAALNTTASSSNDVSISTNF